MNKNNRVLYIAGRSNTLGGGEISLLALIAALDKSMYSPLMIVPERGRLCDWCISKNIPVHIFVVRHWFLLIAICKSILFLKREKVAIIHSNAAATKESVVFLVAAKIIDIPYVYHIRVVETNLLERILLRYATINIAISKCVYRKVRNYRTQKKTVVIYNGVDTNLFRSRKDVDYFYEELGIERGRDVIGVFSRLVPWKGHLYFLEVARNICNKLPQVYFIIVGDGDNIYRQTLKEYAQQLNLHNIIWQPFRTDIPLLMSFCSIVVNPSIEEEGFGRTVIEAMSCKRVVVATMGGVAEFIEDGENGFLVPSLDRQEMAAKIVDILQDKGRMLRMGENARRTVIDKFDIKNHVRKIEDIYALFFCDEAVS